MNLSLNDNGQPAGRDPEFLSTVVNFAFAVSIGRDVLNVIPGVFRGYISAFFASWYEYADNINCESQKNRLAGRFLPWSKRAIRKTSEYMTPLIQERLQKLRELGDEWPDKPVSISIPTRRYCDI